MERIITVRIGNSIVDFKGLLIDGPQGSLSIEPKVMHVLRVLCDNAGEVMTRETLIETVWGVEHGGDERLSRAISILRKALGDKRGDHTQILTISRVGYRLTGEVNQNPAAAVFPVDVKPRGERFQQALDIDGAPLLTRFIGVMALILALALIGAFSLVGDLVN